MGIFNFFGKKDTPQTAEPKAELMSFHKHQFNTPFGQIGGANLSLPYVREYAQSETYIKFGLDNLFPQLLNQLVYTSPLHSGIIQFKANSTIGGGYTLESFNDKSAKQKVDEYTFERVNNIPKLIRELTKDLIVHSRIAVLIEQKDKYVSIKRIGVEKVRVDCTKTQFTICDDWSRMTGRKCYPAYYDGIQEPSIYYWETDCENGQEFYPIPLYAAANNWIALDGEIAYLQKNNILNGIFPSFMLTVAKKWQSDAELQAFKKTIDNAKSSREAGRIMVFAGENPDELPSLTSIPVNNNDKLFTETTSNIEQNICRGHQIDALILGIRPSGKLGSGAELPMAYSIYEKNVVIPLRRNIEEFMNDILFISGIQSKFKITDYQIVDTQIIQKP